jgi:hypothetical protein
MPTTVHLNDIIDVLEMQFDDSSSFLDRAARHRISLVCIPHGSPEVHRTQLV